MDSYTMEHYSAVKEDEIMKFSCKYMEREKNHPDIGNPESERQIWYVLIYISYYIIWILVIKHL